MKLKIIVHYDDSFTEKEKAKHQAAMALAEIAINSIEFRDAIINHKATSSRLSGLTIYNMIMSGKDNYESAPNNEVDIYPSLYYKDNNTIGYTYANTKYTWLNRKFFAIYDYAKIAMNGLHEYLHNLGTGHSSAKDKNSWPYFIGYLVRDLVARLVKGETLYPVFTLGDIAGPIENAPKPQDTTLPVSRKQKVVCCRSWRTFFIKRCYRVKA